MKSLVIEDNDNNMELISYILEQHGYETVKAVNGKEGCRLALAEKPDFILLDIQLPDIMGTEVLKILRDKDETKAIPVIAVTSYAMDGDRDRLLEAGCDGYIEKPIDPMTFIAQIEKVIGGAK